MEHIRVSLCYSCYLCRNTLICRSSLSVFYSNIQPFPFTLISFTLLSHFPLSQDNPDFSVGVIHQMLPKNCVHVR